MNYRTKKNLTLAALLTTGLLIGNYAVASGKHCGEGEHKTLHAEKHLQKRMERLATKLNLNDEQKALVESIMQEQHAEIQRSHESNRAALKKALGGVLSADQMQVFDAMMEKGRGRQRQEHRSTEKDKNQDAAS